MTIRTKTLIWLLLPSILIAAIVATFYFYHTKRTIKQNVFDNLEIAASEAKEHVLLFLKEKSGRTLDFSSDGFIRDCTEEITGKANRKEYYTTLLNNHLITNKKSLDSNIIEVFVVDFEGKVIASTEKSNIGKDISSESYFTNVEYLSAFTSGPHYSEHSKANIINFSTVLLSNIGKEALGIIVNRIRIGPEGEQNQDITTIQQDGKPGNTKLVYANKIRIMDFSSDGFIKDCAEELTKRDDRESYYTGILNTHLSMNKRHLDPEIISVFITDLNGTIIGSSEFGLLGKDVSEELYFQKTMKRGSFISDPHRYPGIEHGIIEISRLLTSKNDYKPIGIIVNRYNGDGFSSITRSRVLDESGTDMLLKGLGDTGEVYVVNADKVMLTDSRFIKDAAFNQVVDTEGVSAAFNNGEGMIGIYADYRGIPILGVSKYIEEMDWVVLAEKDVSEAFAPITHLRNFTIITGIVSIIIIVAIANFLAAGITRPIRKLIKGTEKLSNGKLSYRIDSRSEDEIGKLATSFNNMAASLEEVEKQLQDYADHLEEKVEEKTKKLKLTLNEKETLLKEVHHRVKNNMQVISSLLNLQAARIEDKNLLDIFKESQNRIKSMAHIHEELYQTEDLANIKFDEYVRKLTGSLMNSYVIHPNSISLILNIDNVYLGVDAAIPCGLIINELFTNSLKYAFPGITGNTEHEIEGKTQKVQRKDTKGEISINFTLENNRYVLLFSDNGVGLPEDLDFQNTNTLGLDLVNTLTQQLGGAIELDRTRGTQFKIMFKV